MTATGPNNKILLMKWLHHIDQQMVRYNHQEFQTFQIPEEFIKQHLDIQKNELLSKCDGTGPEENFIKAGSRVEGATLARMFKEYNLELDFVVLWGTLQNKDRGIEFDSIPGMPGMYKVQKIVIEEEGTQIEASQLKRLSNQTQERAPYDNFGGMGSLVGDSVHQDIELQEHGPAGTQELWMNAGFARCSMASTDTVPALELDFWPPEAANWIQRPREWPPTSVIADILEHPVFLVHKPTSPAPEHAHEWYVSFTLAEQIISQRRTEDMKLTYLFFKTIFYCCFKFKVEEKEFGSYLAKTTMNWACEELHPEQWNQDNLEWNLRILFMKLFNYLKPENSTEKRGMPHYFIPELNLLQHLPEGLFDAMDTHINKDGLISDPLSFLPDRVQSICYESHHQLRLLMIYEKLAAEISATMGWPKRGEGTELVRTSVKGQLLYQTFMVACVQLTMMMDQSLVRSECPIEVLVDSVRDHLNGDIVARQLKKNVDHLDFSFKETKDVFINASSELQTLTGTGHGGKL